MCFREEGEEKPKPTENQDDGYETSNSGEAARRKPSSAEGSPAPPAEPSPPPDPPYEPLMRHYEPEPEPYRHFEPPAPPPPQPEPQYQHFPFPKYGGDPYAFKREPEVPYDMSQHHQYAAAGKRDEDMYNGIKRECEDPYSFVEEEAMCAMLAQPQHHAVPPHLQHHDHHAHMMHPQQMMLNQPKKRGRKKKIKDENGSVLVSVRRSRSVPSTNHYFVPCTEVTGSGCRRRQRRSIGVAARSGRSVRAHGGAAW